MLPAENVTEKLPLFAPAEVGANVKEHVTLCPPDSVTGYTSPLRVNPDPTRFACVIVILGPPEFVSVIEAVFVLPTGIVPKLTLEGATTSWMLGAC